MCDICGNKIPGEFHIQYVLTVTDPSFPFQRIYKTTEVARVDTSICEACYEKQTGIAELSNRQLNFWKFLRLWFRALFRPKKEEILQSIALDKLKPRFPKATRTLRLAKALEGLGASSLKYNIWTAEEWEKAVRDQFSR